MQKKLVFMVLLLLFCNLIFTQTTVAENSIDEQKITTLTIEDAVDYAIKNSRSLKSAAIDLEIKKNAKNNCWNVIVPTVNATGTFALSNELSSQIENLVVNPKDPNNKTSGVIGINAQLNLNLALIQGIKATKANYEAGLITWEQNLKETELNVRKMFYGILMQQESLKLQEVSLQNALDRYEQAKKNYESGLVPELMLLQSQVAYENQKPSLVKAKQAVEQQLDMFAFILGMNYGTKIKLEGVIEPTFKDFDAENLVAQYLTNRLDVQSMKKNIELLRISLAASNLSTYTPSLSLGYSRQPVFAPFKEVTDLTDIAALQKITSLGGWDNRIDNGSFSATLAWNVTNMLPFSSNGVKIKETKENIKKLEITLQTVLQNAEMEIHHLVDKLEQSQASIGISQRNVNLAEKSYQQTYEAYKAGTQELLDVKDAENQMNQAKLGLMSEKMNYISNLLDLEYAINSKLN